MKAPDILRAAADTIDQRGRERDMPGGERSMGRAVAAFNCLYAAEIASAGGLMSEAHGWAFMEVLKAARGWGDDDCLDRVAYAALVAEAAGRGA